MNRIDETAAAEATRIGVLSQVWAVWQRLTRHFSFFAKGLIAVPIGIPEHTSPLDAVQSEADGTEPALTGEALGSQSMNYWLDVLLEIPEFPATEDDAENMLRFVRSQRDECEHRKAAVELALHQCVLQLQILQRKMMDHHTVQRLSDLERYREELEQAITAVAEADRRVGTVRTLLRRKALPLIFGRNYDFRGFPPTPPPPVHCDDRSDDSEHSVGRVSDLEVEGDSEEEGILEEGDL